MTYLIVALVVALVVWRATRVVRWWRAPAELPEPRRPFMTELEERKLERKLGIGLPAPVYYTGPFPNIKNANGEPCFKLTQEDVRTIAVELIAAGKAKDVKAALSDFGVLKVVNVPDEQLAAFADRMQEYAGMDDDPIDDPF